MSISQKIKQTGWFLSGDKKNLSISINQEIVYLAVRLTQRKYTPMITIMASIGISVSASLLTMVLIVISKLVWKYKIENLILDKFSRGYQDISGVWHATSELENKMTSVDKTTIEQHGYKINGTSVYTLTHQDGKTETKEFEICGVVKNDLVSAYYVNKNRRQKGMGSFTYKIQRDGNSMLGHGVFYSVDDNDIVEQDYELNREERA